ncbi:MAG: heme-binding protein [Pseudomonadota bacterium]
MPKLNLAAAVTITEHALAHAKAQSMNPMTVAVLDAGGHLLAFQRQDKSGILRPQIAIGKAWGVLGMGIGGRDLAKRAESHPVFFGALAAASEGRIFPVAGGVLVRDADGEVLGAVGISGDLPPHDEACAIAGIAAAGLTADAGSA